MVSEGHTISLRCPDTPWTEEKGGEEGKEEKKQIKKKREEANHRTRKGSGILGIQ